MTASRTPKSNIKEFGDPLYTKWPAQDKLSRSFWERDFHVLIQGSTVYSMSFVYKLGGASNGHEVFPTYNYSDRECSMGIWNVQTDPVASSTVMARFPDPFYQCERTTPSYFAHFSEGLIYCGLHTNQNQTYVFNEENTTPSYFAYFSEGLIHCGLYTNQNQTYVFNEEKMTWYPVKWIGLDAKESFAEFNNGIRADENAYLSRAGSDGNFTFYLSHIEQDQDGNEVTKVDKAYKVYQQYNKVKNPQMKKLEAGHLVSNFTKHLTIYGLQSWSTKGGKFTPLVTFPIHPSLSTSDEKASTTVEIIDFAPLIDGKVAFSTVSKRSWFQNKKTDYSQRKYCDNDFDFGDDIDQKKDESQYQIQICDMKSSPAKIIKSLTLDVKENENSREPLHQFYESPDRNSFFVVNRQDTKEVCFTRYDLNLSSQAYQMAEQLKFSGVLADGRIVCRDISNMTVAILDCEALKKLYMAILVEQCLHRNDVQFALLILSYNSVFHFPVKPDLVLPRIALDSSSGDAKKNSSQGSTIAPPGGLRVSGGLSAYAASFTPSKSSNKGDQKPVASALSVSAVIKPK